MEAQKNRTGGHQRRFIAPAVMVVLLLCVSCSSPKQVPAKPAGPVQSETTSRPRKPARTVSAETKIIEEARRWLGTPYRYGGNERGRGTDCSGMVMEVYLKAVGVSLPRTSQAQCEFCTKIKVSQLTSGDLVFFKTSRSNRINHVGIYISDGCFIHATTSKGVIISNLSEKYYQNHFHSAARVPGIKK